MNPEQGQVVYDAAKRSVGQVADAEGPFVQLRSRDGIAWDAERENLSPVVSVDDLAAAVQSDLRPPPLPHPSHMEEACPRTAVRHARR